MKVLVACDLLPTEIEGQHIQDDVLKHLDERWDLMIAHPPCTHLAVSGDANHRLESGHRAIQTVEG